MIPELSSSDLDSSNSTGLSPTHIWHYVISDHNSLERKSRLLPLNVIAALRQLEIWLKFDLGFKA